MCWVDLAKCVSYPFEIFVVWADGVYDSFGVDADVGAVSHLTHPLNLLRPLISLHSLIRLKKLNLTLHIRRLGGSGERDYTIVINAINRRYRRFGSWLIAPILLTFAHRCLDDYYYQGNK